MNVRSYDGFRKLLPVYSILQRHMRLFIAIQFKKNILDALTDFQADLKSQGVTGNYTKRENLHITLAFIGDYGNPDEVLDAMEQVDFRPIEISLDGVGDRKSVV